MAVDAVAGTSETMRHSTADRAGLGGVDGDDVRTVGGAVRAARAARREGQGAECTPSPPIRHRLSNLWLTIHESIGHGTEYDRAIGYEAADAGTSFATRDKLGTTWYGSQVMNVTADRTEGLGLASVGWDDEASRLNGGIWCATATSSATNYREFAPWLGTARSNGCRTPTRRTTCRSSGWRCVVAAGRNDRSTDDLIARVEEGIYIIGDKSWSIEHAVNNFQFTGQRSSNLRRQADGQRPTRRTRSPPPTSGARWMPSAARRPAAGRRIQSERRSLVEVAPVSDGCPSASSGHQRAQHPCRRGALAVIGQSRSSTWRHGGGTAGKADESIVLVTDRSDAARAANGSMTTKAFRRAGTTVISIVRRVTAATSHRHVERGGPVGHPRSGGGLAGDGVRHPRPGTAYHRRPGLIRRSIGTYRLPARGRGVRRRRQRVDSCLSRIRPAVRVRAAHPGDDIRRHFRRVRRALHRADRLVEINAERDGASAWAGTSTADFVDVPTDRCSTSPRTRLGWAQRP